MKAMPLLGAQFAKDVADTLLIAAATESLWLNAPPASAIRKQLKAPQLEALYEATYLRVFTYWENFLEDVTIRWMANFGDANYSPSASNGKVLLGTLSAARLALFDGRDYLLWHSPGQVIDRVGKHLTGCPIELTLLAEKQRIEHYSRVRHRVAHGSADAIDKFKAAAVALTGSEQSGRAGHLLRAPRVSDPLNQTKWIRVISDDLITFAQQITP